MFLLEYGAECVPKSMSVRGAGEDLRWEPVIGIVVETALGWVVLETGFSRRVLDDEEACRAIYGFPGSGSDYIAPRALPGEPFASALEGVGLRPDDIAVGVVSHLHIDHSGGVPLLAEAGVPVVIQQRELDFAQERAGIAEAYYRSDYSGDVQWRVLEGDAEIAPGVSAIFTPGHTPGHMSYQIDLPQTGTWIFAIDAADLGENLFDRVPVGTAADPADEPKMPESLEKLLERAERLDARLVPGHDPFFWRAVRSPPDGHL